MLGIDRFGVPAKKEHPGAKSTTIFFGIITI
jgi:hypothetical protein